ncbi:hypothetical protein [Mycetocola zhujimingii]|uniref:Uncharacterized protein n=1 Tax=Mycetocola zhujimingii TaxID=2079792 RepID=A0A2U1TGG5_9MICO|nr:hypothetical protein [Mycetocola zhujimingii]PWC07910.1 hypothetical protein DF223_00675 [Mycetocola zhujimingii]
MTASPDNPTPPRWLWVVALVWTLVVIGLGLWVALSTGQWIALVLAFALAAPIDVMLVRRSRGATGADA